MPNPQKWLHVSEIGGDQWVLPIWRSIHQAVKEKRMQPVDDNIKNLALYVSIKLNMLPKIVERIRTGFTDLCEKVKSTGQRCRYEFTTDKEGCAFEIDFTLKYNLLIDIDSLLFELNSCCELMKEYCHNLYNSMGEKIDKNNIGKIIREIIENKGESSQWFIDLDSLRNFAIHEGALYIAVDLSYEPTGYDLLIMKENIKTFDDETKFTRLSVLNEIVQGFIRAKSILQMHFIQQIDTLT